MAEKELKSHQTTVEEIRDNFRKDIKELRQRQDKFGLVHRSKEGGVIFTLGFSNLPRKLRDKKIAP
jgi:hypothetical protein